MPSGAELLDRARSVQAELRGHKRAIRQHREGAQIAAAELERIMAECARLGIAFSVAPVRGPGRPASDGRA